MSGVPEEKRDTSRPEAYDKRRVVQDRYNREVDDVPRVRVRERASSKAILSKAETDSIARGELAEEYRENGRRVG